MGLRVSTFGRPLFAALQFALACACCGVTYAQSGAGAGASSPAASGPITLPERTQSKLGSSVPFDDPLPQYPAGSINSVARGQAAVLEAAAARKRQIQHYEQQKKACYKDFFAERCLSKARDEDYQIVRRINSVDLEARDFQRRSDAAEHTRERDEREAKRRANEVGNEAERQQKVTGQEAKRESKQQSNQAFQGKAGERAKQAEDSKKREQDRRDDLAKREAQRQAEAPERAERARERAQDVDEVLKHAAEREAKAKEKQKEREQKRKEKPLVPVPDEPNASTVNPKAPGG